MRACRLCGEVKQPDAFYARRTVCKPCYIGRNNANPKRAEHLKRYDSSAKGKLTKSKHRRSDKHRAREKLRRATESYKAPRRTYAREERERHPMRCAARIAVNRALSGKRLTKPGHCRCGSTERITAHHHAGYEQHNWLNVIWLCWKCHTVEHHGESPHGSQ